MINPMNETPEPIPEALAIPTDQSVIAYTRIPSVFCANLYGALVAKFFDSLRFFTNDGRVLTVTSWEMTPTRSPLLNTILAYTFNPKVSVTCTYSTAPYELAELQRELCKAVDADDDILTQFHETDELKSSIQSASNYAEIWQVLKDSVSIRDETQGK
jgi:hypothetical protein